MTPPADDAMWIVLSAAGGFVATIGGLLIAAIKQTINVMRQFDVLKDLIINRTDSIRDNITDKLDEHAREDDRRFHDINVLLMQRRGNVK